MQEHRIAVTHASGILAEAILEKLSESGVAADALILLDEETHVGVKKAYGKTYLAIQDEHDFDFGDCSLVLMLDYNDELVHKLDSLDAMILSHTFVDDSASVFAADSESSLGISYTQQKLKIAGAELSSLLGVLPTLHAEYPLAQINAVFLRSAESRGKAGIDELASQTISLLNAQEAKPGCYPLQIAFNLIPEESSSALNTELIRILGNETIQCSHQVVDVPVFHGFGVAVQLRFSSEVTIDACEKLLSGIKNVEVKGVTASPITDCNQSFSCVITRLEQVQNQPNMLQFWMIADPLRYGLANNYVNVTDILLKSYL